MHRPVPLLASLALMAVALVAVPDSAQAKCNTSTGIPVLPDHLYVVDDEVTEYAQVAPGLVEAQFQDLVAAQRAYRSAHGSYAGTLDELDFFASRSRLGIRMTLGDDGWTAELQSGELGLECHVAGGSARTRHPGQVVEVPHCQGIDPDEGHQEDGLPGAPTRDRLSGW